MDITFVEDSEDDIHRYNGGQKQPGFIGQRITKDSGGTLEARDTLGHSDFLPSVLNGLHRIASEAPGARLKESVVAGNWPW